MTSEAVCARCGGTGFIVVEHANLSSAEPCECRAQLRAAGLQDKAQIPPLYQNASFDSFKHLDDPLLRRIMNDVSSYAASFAKLKKQGLLLTGEPGTGKTHLAVAALRSIMSTTASKACSAITRTCWTASARAYDPASNSSDQRSVPECARCRNPAAGRPGRASRHGLGGGHRHLHHHLPLQQPEAPDRHHQPAGSATRQRRHAADRRWTSPNTAAPWRTASASARVSRLFEMCTRDSHALVEDYRLRKARRLKRARRVAVPLSRWRPSPAPPAPPVASLRAGGGVSLLSLPADALGARTGVAEEYRRPHRRILHPLELAPASARRLRFHRPHQPAPRPGGLLRLLRRLGLQAWVRPLRR